MKAAKYQYILCVQQKLNYMYIVKYIYKCIKEKEVVVVLYVALFFGAPNELPWLINTRNHLMETNLLHKINMGASKATGAKLIKDMLVWMGDDISSHHISEAIECPKSMKISNSLLV